MLAADLSTILANDLVDDDDFGRNDLDARGLMGGSIFLLLPFVKGDLGFSSAWSISIFSPSSAIWLSAWSAFDWLGPLSLCRVGLLRVATSSISSWVDGFLLRSRREPSIGSSVTINWLKTEWESGLIAPLCGGKRSPAILSLDILRAARSRGSSTSGAAGSGTSLLETQSGQYHDSASTHQ